MIIDALLSDKKQFVDVQGRKFWFISYDEKSCNLTAWKEENSCSILTAVLHASEVSKKALEFLGINYTGDTRQPEFQPKNEFSGDAVPQEGGKKRRRNMKAIEVPEMLTCKKCGGEQKLNKPYIVAKAEKLGVTVDEVIASFECQKCTPTKGKKSSKNYDGVPDKLVCPCGHETKYHPSTIMSMAEKKGISVKELEESYKCQTCNPTKGRKAKVKSEDK